MVLGLKKKQHKVPDLSRYDYYYEQDKDTDKDSGLSAAAAAAAGRSHSMVQGPTRTMQTRSNSQPYRSYSLRPHTAVGTQRGHRPERLSSFAQRRGPASRTSSMASTPASITVKTTEVKDLQGRTRSITKQTVRRINGYEYVETTTTTRSNAQDPERHFDEFTTDFTDDLDFQDQSSGHPALIDSSGLMYNNSSSTGSRQDGNVDEDEDDNSEFSDAVDYMPPNKRVAAKPKTRLPRKESLRQRKPLSEQEMYSKALEAAKKKVYGDRIPETVVAVTPAPSTRMSSLMRSSENASPSVAEGSSSRKTKTLSRSISQKLFKQPQNDPVPVGIVANGVSASEIPHRMTEAEMYAQALEIARKKYASQQEQPIQQNVVNTIEEEPEEAILVEAQNENQVNQVPTASYGHSIPVQQAATVNHPSEVGGVSGPSPKKKFKNFFSKVVQFSQENYGYQPKKDSDELGGDPIAVSGTIRTTKEEVARPTNGLVSENVHVVEETAKVVTTPANVPASGSLNSHTNVSRQSSSQLNLASAHASTPAGYQLSESSGSADGINASPTIQTSKQHSASHRSSTHSSISAARNGTSTRHSPKEDSVRDVPLIVNVPAVEEPKPNVQQAALDAPPATKQMQVVAVPGGASQTKQKKKPFFSRLFKRS